MTTSRSNDRHIPQLIPHRLVRDRLVHSPAVFEDAKRRSENLHLRLADRITAFAGSMTFVYLHVIMFAVWIGLLEMYPWSILALTVSLEAIFLSTFVMIGQNRQAAFQQAKADHDYQAQDLELKTNTELTRQIQSFTEELHRHLIGGGAEGPPGVL